MEFDHTLELQDQILISVDPNPPFEETYKALFDGFLGAKSAGSSAEEAEECELPLIDLGRLMEGDERKKKECKMEIGKASKEWGFFRVVNHGISVDVLEGMKKEQAKVFKEPFCMKRNDAFMEMTPGSYRWGSPMATCLRQLSWSEAFHIPLGDLGFEGFCSPLSLPVRRFAEKAADLAQLLASILAENLGQESAFFMEECLPSACYLRMNRYPPCPNYSDEVFGLMPHTDSDFLTILYEDQIGGLHVVKDGRWIAIKPNPEALIVNIGDLFEAWSDGVYKSVEHRVVVNKMEERFSTAYFLCPTCDSVIRGCGEPPAYREFSFKEYRQQVNRDVKSFGHKIGLSRFLACNASPKFPNACFDPCSQS